MTKTVIQCVQENTKTDLKIIFMTQLMTQSGV